MGRCRGLYADGSSSNLSVGYFFLFFRKRTYFFALGFRGFGSRV